MKDRLKLNPGFRRLKYGGLGLNARTTYWLGQDHLLLVDVANYTERYRRFYFRDIQAVTVQSSQARLWWNFGLALLLVLSLFGVALAWIRIEPGSSLAGVLTFAVGCSILALLGLAGLLLNALRGPMCSVYIRTAVQTQRLRGLTRWRKAEALLNELSPLIQSAQAEEERARDSAPEKTLG